MRKAKPVYLNALQRAIESSQKLPQLHIDNLKGIMRQALNMLHEGKGNQEDFRNLVDAFNTGEQLAELGICSNDECRVMLQNGQSSLLGIYERHQAKNEWSLIADDIWPLNEAIFIHGVQLGFVSLGEYTLAQKMIREKSRQAIRGNKPAGVRVLC